jgi:hypothetical protein
VRPRQRRTNVIAKRAQEFRMCFLDPCSSHARSRTAIFSVDNE